MAPNINRPISFKFSEYVENYKILLHQFLSKHEDFDENEFIDQEISFYKLCYSNANIIKANYDDKYIYCVNGGNCEILIPEIYDSLVTFKDEDDGWDIELSIQYKATFKKIINFLENRKESVPLIQKLREIITFGVSLCELDLKSQGMTDEEAQETVSNMRKEFRLQVEPVLESFKNPTDKARLIAEMLVKLFPKAIEERNLIIQNQLNGILDIDFSSEATESYEDHKIEKESSTAKNQNDFIKSTICDYLEDIKEFTNESDYLILVDALHKYFTTNQFPKLNRKINFKPVNKKKVGWALKQTYRSIKRGIIDIEFYKFAQKNINLFEDEIIVLENFNKSNFYKFFHTNC